MLNALRGAHAAIAQAITTLTGALHATADNHARKSAATTASIPARTERKELRAMYSTSKKAVTKTVEVEGTPFA
jgi:hypothetical protein